MSDNRFVLGTVERNTSELQGLSLLKEDKIKCENCHNPLVEVIKVKEDKTTSSAIKVQCPYCKNKTFWYKTSGKICIQSVSGLSIVDMPTNLRNGIYFTEITLIKG